MAKKFTGNRPTEERDRRLKALGYEHNSSDAEERGSEWSRYLSTDGTKQLLINHVAAFILSERQGEKRVIADERSTDLDGTDWYDALLDALYTSEEVETSELSDDKYELGIPFIDGTPSFVNGFECGTIYALMRAEIEIEDVTVHSCNLPQLVMIAEAHNYELHSSKIDDTFSQITCEYVGEDDDDSGEDDEEMAT